MDDSFEKTLDNSLNLLDKKYARVYSYNTGPNYD